MMSVLFRTASLLNGGTRATLKTLKYSRPTLKNVYFATSAFAVGKTVKLDTYESRRKNAVEKLKFATEELRLKIISSLDAMNQVNSRDVQELIFTAEEQDVELVLAALKKLELQSERLRFTDFNLDAVTMRMFAYLNLPEKAYETFLDEDFKKLFSGYNGVVILLDMLYKNGLYQNVLNSVECLERRQNFNVWSSRGVGCFYMTACLKLNTPETLQKGLVHYEKILKYRQAVPELNLVSALISLYANSEKLDTFLRMLGNNPLYLDIKANMLLQRLIAAGKLADVEEYLKLNKCVLAKDTYELITSLSEDKDSDRFGKIIKSCKILDYTLEDWVIQENSRHPVEKDRASKPFRRGRQREEYE